ncbi:P-loop containing nucleoside triphosphate hydrolase protein [Trichoderma chlorosporum]
MASNDKETAPSSTLTDTSTLVLDVHSTTNQVNSSEPARASFKHLFSFTKWSHTGPLVAAVIASAAFASIKSVLSVILGSIFDVISDFGAGRRSGTETMDKISHWGLILLAMGIANWLASTAFLALWVIFGELQANSARQGIFKSLLSMEMSWYDSLDQGVSSLLVRIQTQTRELQLATSQVLGLLVADTVLSLASLAIAFSHSWKLTLVLLGTLPVSVVVMSLATRRLDPAIQAQKRELETASKFATSSIKAIEIVKVFNGFDRELWQYYEAVKSAGKQYLIQAQCNCIQMGYVAFWVVGMFVAGFWYGTVLVDGGLTPGQVMTTFFAVLSAFQAIESLLPHWLVLSKGMSAGAFLSSMSNKKDDKKADTNGPQVKAETCVGNVDMVDVTFAYPSNPTKIVLNRSSFSFSPRQLTFIVGRSGSGKSTIGNLLAQFYEPSSGLVCLDGQPLASLDQNWVRSNIALIQQLSVVFDDSVFNNVAVGLSNPENVTKEAVSSACEFALLQSTLSSLPEGLDTRIGSNGLQLSGGQRQRIALARARIRDPTVLILDEVTSSLDQINRGLVIDAIREWRRDKTTIIITHDISQIEDEDFVYVMEDASLVQQGLRRELSMSSAGPFATMACLNPIEPPLTPSPTEMVESTLLGSADCSASIISELPQDIALPISHYMLKESINDEMDSTWDWLSQHKALGAGTAMAWKMRKDQIWETSDLAEERPRSADRTTCCYETEKRQSYSSFDEYFERPRRCSAPEPGCMPYPSRDHKIDMFDDSGYNTDDLLYVFGKADRRDDIPRLRLASSRELPKNSDEDNATNHKAAEPSALLATLGTVWPTLAPCDRAIFLLGIVLLCISSAATPMFSFCLAKLFGVLFLPTNRTAEAKQWAIYLVVIAVVDAISTGYGHYLLERTGQSWVNALRSEALKKILRQPKSWFDKEDNSASRVNECLDRNAEETRNLVGRFIPIFITTFGMISISMLWALSISWKLTLVALSPLPLIIGSVKGYTVLSGKWETKCNQGAADAGAILNETFVNIRVVRALMLEKYFGAKYEKLISHTLSLGKKRAGYTCWLFGLYQSMNYPMTALVFYYATLLLSKGDGVSTTQVLQVINLLLFSIGSSTGALSSMPQLTMAQATATQLLAYAKMPIDSDEESQDGIKISTPLPIVLNNVKFAYSQSPNSHVLRGVSLDITRGSCTAIVGSSGSGKSTIISLLMGLYCPSGDTSSLTYAGVSFSKLDKQHLRSTMAYVSQTPHLFPASIVENIAYGLPKDSPLRNSLNVYAAAQAAGIHDFIISLPEGYATTVGDGGISLSGGQAQRLSIARALVRQPRLLVLDEPTSALDAESSGMIRQTVRELVERAKEQQSEMAIVVVTHTPDMMQICDNIAMIDGGIKVEEGSYEELMKAKGPFRHLISKGEWHGGDVS